MKIKRVVRTSFVLAFVALALGGCGGGSSSSGGGFGFELDDFGRRQGARSAAEDAATAIPTKGSVTQSSNVDGSNITQDQIQATATYVNGGLRISTTNQRSWGTVSTGDVRIRGRDDLVGSNTGNTYRQRTFGKSVTDGVVLMDVYTDRINAADTDYLVGGVWVFIPRDVTSLDDLDMGAFMDGEIAPTPSSYLRTSATATYTGDATGLYLGNDDTGEFGGEFIADAELTASFGPTSPSIRGEINNFVDVDLDRDILDEITDINGDPVTLTLSPAAIENAPGGFFNAETSARVEVARGVFRDFDGKWGGQFYGAEAGRVGGTFGARASSSNYNAAFVGAFAAEKN